MDKDQIQGARKQGLKCDAGAIEVGSLAPKWSSIPEKGIAFPLIWTDLDAASETKLTIKNAGGGVIKWTVFFEDNPGGIFTLVDGPVSGALGKDQFTELTYRCTPNGVGEFWGRLLIQTDLPEVGEVRYKLRCKVMENQSQPAAYADTQPGTTSLGQSTPDAFAQTQVSVGNPSTSPLDATVNLQDALADTIKFTASAGAVQAGQIADCAIADCRLPQPNVARLASDAAPQVDLTVPPGGTLTIDISCEPSAPGIYTGTLTIASNDPIAPLLRYDLSCEGAPAPDPEGLILSATSQELPQALIMGMALSPDGTQLLAGHWGDEKVAIYNVNPSSGGLSFDSHFSQPDMGTITGVRYSSDGKFVYYTSYNGDGVVIASRSADDVELCGARHQRQHLSLWREPAQVLCLRYNGRRACARHQPRRPEPLCDRHQRRFVDGADAQRGRW
jgi:hypothetical protein